MHMCALKLLPGAGKVSRTHEVDSFGENVANSYFEFDVALRLAAKRRSSLNFDFEWVLKVESFEQRCSGRVLDGSPGT